MPILLSTAAFAFHGSVENPAVVMDAVDGVRDELDGIDLFIFIDDSWDMAPLPGGFLEWLGSFGLVSFHLSMAHPYDAGEDGRDLPGNVLDAVAGAMRRTGCRDLTIHADCFARDGEGLLQLIKNSCDCRLALELMDATRAFGNRVEHCMPLMASHPDLGMVPDLAHLDEMRHVASPAETFEALAGRIRYVHGSLSGGRVAAEVQVHWYSRRDVRHVPAVLGGGDVIEDLAGLAVGYPLILEGAVPKGAAGLQLLRDEIRWWSLAQGRGQALVVGTVESG
ncbi:MAG: hypothetical protein V3571_07070 [Pseudodesulfovibrio sp.]